MSNGMSICRCFVVGETDSAHAPGQVLSVVEGNELAVQLSITTAKATVIQCKIVVLCTILSTNYYAYKS